MDKQKIMQRILGDVLVPGKRYHSPLPPELVEWYAYTSDGGHSIICLLAEDAGEAFASHDVIARLVPCPVKAVLRGYRVVRGYG